MMVGLWPRSYYLHLMAVVMSVEVEIDLASLSIVDRPQKFLTHLPDTVGAACAKHAKTVWGATCSQTDIASSGERSPPPASLQSASA